MGVCASSGGMFNNYALVQGVDQIVPVDVYAPGCPPGPETLIHAIETLRDSIESGELLRRREQTGSGAGLVIEQRDGIAEPVVRPAGTAAVRGGR
jgi:NADH-quinone oxidoreductase subunit B